MGKMTFREFKRNYDKSVEEDKIDIIDGMYSMGLTEEDIKDMVNNIIEYEYKKYLADN